MPYNGIEYGVMAAYAEGLNILRSANVGRHDRPEQAGPGAETTPLRDPGLYRFEMHLPEIAELVGYGGRVSNSGEGRWTVQAAINAEVPVLSAALFERFTSRGDADFTNRVLSAMQYEFGGHAEKPA